jgi:hypothetical protein
VEFVRRSGGEALAIEANPYTFEHLTSPAESRGVSTLHVGRSHQAGSALFNVRPGLERADSTSFLQKPGVMYDQVEVSTTTLNAVAAAHVPAGKTVALWVAFLFLLVLLNPGQQRLAAFTKLNNS